MTIDEYDRIAERLQRARALSVLIAGANNDTMVVAKETRIAAYMVDELITEAVGVLRVEPTADIVDRVADPPKRKRGKRIA